MLCFKMVRLCFQRVEGLIAMHFSHLGSLFSHYTEQQTNQVPAGIQQQYLQIASMPTIQTSHVPPVVSTPVPIQPKPTTKPIAPATINPSIGSHKQSFQSKVRSKKIIIS